MRRRDLKPDVVYRIRDGFTSPGAHQYSGTLGVSERFRRAVLIDLRPSEERVEMSVDIDGEWRTRKIHPADIIEPVK